MGEYELPLVIFTVFSQWAVGIIIAVALLEWFKPKYMESVGKKVLKTPVIAALCISVIGTLASMLHLNNPFKSYTSLIGIAHSWLSREIIAVILFNICLLILTYLWWKKVDQTTIRKAIGTLSALMGIIMIIISATVYFSMPLHPAWNNWTTFANFLLTGFLLGTLTVVYFVIKFKQAEEEGSVTKLLGIYLSLIIAALLVTLGSSAAISNGSAEGQIAATVSFTSMLFWIRILGSLLIPATLVTVMILAKKMIPINYVLAATAFVLIGEFAGRMMFYNSVMSQNPWF